MRAETVSIGTELLLGQIADTNAADLGVFLAQNGVEHTHRQTVGDNLPRIVKALTFALSRSDIVFTIGGLGPTPDDLTRQAVAEALGESLIRDETIVEHLQNEYGKRGLKMTESQFRQADRPPSSEPIPNQNGTAPGLLASKNGKHIVALPGPKNEFIDMLNGPVKKIVESLRPGPPIFSRTLRVCGIPEASIGEQLADLMDAADPTVAPYAKIGEVHLRISTRCDTEDQAVQKLTPTIEDIKNRLGSAVYAEGEESLEEWIVKTLAVRKETVATAESCTGGLLSGRLTNVAGSSAVFHTGFVTYSAESKQTLVGVLPETIATYGTVAEQTAYEMALGARKKAGSTYGIGITGVAGSDDLIEPPYSKEPGLVYIGISSPKSTKVFPLHLRGSRQTIRDRAVSMALIRFRDLLICL